MTSVSETAADQADAPTGTAGLRWFVHTPMTPAWLVGRVLPELVRLRTDAGATTLVVRRGWLHGPHLEVVAGTADGRPLPWGEVADRLAAATPAAGPPMAAETYLRQAVELGRLEHVEGPYLPLRHHGDVAWVAPEELTPWPRALRADCDRVATEVTEAAAALLDEAARRSPEAVPAVLLAEAFIALADAHPWRAPFGSFSLRSHAEAFLAWSSVSVDPRPVFDRRLEHDLPLLVRLVEQARDGRQSAHALGWRRAFTAAMDRFREAAEAGRLSNELLEELAGAWGPGRDAPMGPPGAPTARRAAAAPFHQQVRASGVTDDPGQWFAGFRLMINLFYRQLPLLGVTPAQRYYLCYAVAGAIDEAHGETWQQRLNRIAQARKDPHDHDRD